MHRVHGTRLRTGTGVDFVPHPYLFTAVLRIGAQRSTVRQVGLRVDIVPSPSCLVLCSSCRRRVRAGSWTRSTFAVPVSSHCASRWRHSFVSCLSSLLLLSSRGEPGHRHSGRAAVPEARQQHKHHRFIIVIASIHHLVRSSLPIQLPAPVS